jgi:Transposase domain (DUF772)
MSTAISTAFNRAGASSECRRNLEVIWLLGRRAPDHKTIADFRKDNGAAIKKVSARLSSSAARWAYWRR